jgi:biotin/methionine sulfoxide reductase
LGSSQVKRFALHLVSPQPRYRLHSQLDTANLSQEHKIQGREPIWINPEDANRRGIHDRDVVKVYNDRGACLAGACLTDRVRPGVVQLETGAWYSPYEAGKSGTLECHGNPNVLTPDKGTSRLGQATSAGSCLVEVERYRGTLPRIEVLRPPPAEADGPLA